MLFLQKKTLEATSGTTPSSSNVVRVVPSRKASRLRFVWFVLGTAFGAALTYYVATVIHNSDPEYSSKQDKALRAFALLESKLAPLPKIAIPAAEAAHIEAPAQLVASAPVNVKAGLELPATLSVPIQRGDTLMSLLMDKGLNHEEAYNAVSSMKKVYDPKRLNIGQSLEMNLDKSKSDTSKASLTGLSIVISPLKTIKLSRIADDSFKAYEVKAPIFKGIARAGGTIHSSLYQTGVDSGVPPQMLGEIINALSYDVDFQRDIKEGDAIDIVYERMHTASNATAGFGKILYVSLTLGSKEFNLYHHMSADGYSGYYNAKGESVKKALLKTPINGAHITSSFGMRVHPLLGYSRMHKGVDFGAATGTPIYAAGDGVIEFAGRKAGYGNYVKVKHNTNYATAYGHASRFASGIHPGVHVKQGQVIAYVGMTGMATGPHLHYEILVNNAQVNPSGVKFRTGQTLAGRELKQFKGEQAQVQTALNTLPQNTQLASLNR
jgi:murein DD-endopeptidase MepM/ murein hydrolase activator NlpD